jgi:hypothetical protein
MAKVKMYYSTLGQMVGPTDIKKPELEQLLHEESDRRPYELSTQLLDRREKSVSA